jgi:hypothetical protein
LRRILAAATESSHLTEGETERAPLKKKKLQQDHSIELMRRGRNREGS